MTITISGTSSNIVEYFNGDPNTPRIPLPTNYFQILALPTNIWTPSRPIIWERPRLTTLSRFRLSFSVG